MPLCSKISLLLLLFVLILFAGSQWLHVSLYRGRAPPVLLRQSHKNLPKTLTVVMTCCPRASNPSTSAVATSLKSLLRFLPGIENCPAILGFDGYDIDANFDSLHINCKKIQTSALRYAQYTQQVGALFSASWEGPLTKIMLPERVCYVGNLQACLEKVRTKYVLVLHDNQAITKPLCPTEIIEAMEDVGANYLLCAPLPPGMPCKGKKRKNSFMVNQDLVIERTVAFSDSTHFATAWFYKIIMLPLLKTNPHSFMDLHVACVPDKMDRYDMYQATTAFSERFSEKEEEED